MRQWAIFIQDLSEKENQLKIIYQREYDNIKGFTRQAFTKGLKDRIHNIAVDTLNSIGIDRWNETQEDETRCSIYYTINRNC